MKQPTRFQEVSFFLKSRYFIGKRLLRNMGSSKNILRDQVMIGPHRLAESVSRLRISNELEHQKLQDGKIHNLKIACKELHGIRIARNEEFSFWKILGRPTTGKGYTVGREIRYGCVIPTVAGGLCQLSGALYEAATRAGFQIIERHAHTATAEGMDIPASRDCTIFWNYVDFKFKPHLDISISAVVMEDELIISFYSSESCTKIEERQLQAIVSKKKNIESCETCHEFDCHQKQKLSFTKTYLLSPTLQKQENDFFLTQGTKYEMVWIPSRLSDFFGMWKRKEGKNLFRIRPILSFKLWICLLQARWKFADQKTVAEKSLSLWKAYAELIEVIFLENESKKAETEFVIDQRLLPWLWNKGILIDKKYSVLFRHLPMVEMQKRLTALATMLPDDPTLIDFRAPSAVLDGEWKSLKSAQKLYSSHDELTTLMERVENLSPAARSTVVSSPRYLTTATLLPHRPYVLFPGPSMSREGKHFVRQFMQTTTLTLCLFESDRADLEFWRDTSVKIISKDQTPWDQIAGVIHPTVFEGKNQLHREAIKRGIPVIGTKGLGLHMQFPVFLIDQEQVELPTKSFRS